MVDACGGGLDLEGSSVKNYDISISECGDIGCFEISNKVHVPILERRCECRTASFLRDLWWWYRLLQNSD